MKKIKLLPVVMSVAVIAAAVPAVGSAADYQKGDVNMDGRIHADDARIALRASADLTPLYSTQYALADVNNDGSVRADDARKILRVAAGLDTLGETIPSQTTPQPNTTVPPTTVPATTTLPPVTVPPVTAPPVTVPPTTKPQTTVPQVKVPQSKQEIADFYKAAVNKVLSGAAGYSKKDWQTIGNLNITGVGVADNAIAGIVGNYITTEADAQWQTSSKGSDEAKRRFPPFTLTDYSKIKSASLTKLANGNYSVKIVMNDEDTPRESGSMMSQVTNSFLSWDDVEKELTNISAIKSYSDVHMIYTNFTIDAEITPDGRFVSLKHTAPVDIKIGSAKILIVSVQNKSAHLDIFNSYTDFKY